MSVLEIKFDCPECGEGLAIDRRAIGHKVACPFCKEPITVPEVAVPETVAVEPIPPRGELQLPPVQVPSLEELASSRPEVPEVTSKPPVKRAAVAVDATLPNPNGETKKGGIPQKRAPGEKPKAAAEGPSAGGAVAPAPVNRPMPPMGAKNPRPPMKPPVGAGVIPSVTAPVLGSSSGADTELTEVPEGYEEKVRRKRKRRNPDEHRLNPREKPKMVAFDEVVDQNSFKKGPGRGKAPIWQRLAVVGSILGIMVAIGLGILKQRELDAADDHLKPEVLEPMEIEFEAAKSRLNQFREADSVAAKMGFVRAPVSMMDGYPSLEGRMEDFYSKYSLNSHFPRLDRASTTTMQQGDSEYLRIQMENKGVASYAYFEKSAVGYVLDWDSFVGYNAVDWTEFLVNPAEDSQSGTFRLIIEPTDDYMGRFQNEEQYLSYRVTDIYSTIHSIAYVMRGTPAEAAIEAEFDKLKSRDAQRVLVIASLTLAERGVDGSHLTYIEKVLRSSWLLP